MLLLTFLAATVAAEPAPTKNVTAYADGNYLYSACTGTSSGAEIACNNYIMGIVDALQMIGAAFGAPMICNKDVVTKQLTDVVTNYLRAHPEVRHHSASSLAYAALEQAFPCSKPGTRQSMKD